MKHQSGFITIIGKPNVGKSTLMNRIIGTKLSIATPKAQTTRHRIKGILNTDEYQIIFSDTPGIIDPHYLLQKKMMDFVENSLEDADAVLFITDLTEAYGEEDLMERLRKIKVPIFVVINKTDLSTSDEINKLSHGWKKHLKPHVVIPVSAKEDFNTEAIVKEIVKILPESPAYFDKEAMSDASMRFFVSEIIREKIFLNYDKEIPYASEVGIEEYKEENGMLKIKAVIYVERETQKGIVIGRKGEALKVVGTQARIDMEQFTGQKVFLELFVKTEKDWRKTELKLKRFGYGLK